MGEGVGDQVFGGLVHSLAWVALDHLRRRVVQALGPSDCAAHQLLSGESCRLLQHFIDAVLNILLCDLKRILVLESFLSLALFRLQT